MLQAGEDDGKGQKMEVLDPDGQSVGRISLLTARNDGCS